MFVPPDARTGAERIGHPLLGAQRAEREHERPRRVHRAVRIGEDERLLLAERVGVGVGVVVDVAAGRLAAQPFGDVARVAVGAPGQLVRRARRGGQRPVEAEAVAHHHVAGGHRRAEVGDEPAQHLVQLVFVHPCRVPFDR